jgi:hypothetical protein
MYLGREEEGVRGRQTESKTLIVIAAKMERRWGAFAFDASQMIVPRV